MKFIIVTTAGSRVVDAASIYEAATLMSDYECQYAKCLCIAEEQ